MHKNFRKTISFFLTLIFSCCPFVYAQVEKEQTTLKMFYDEEDVVVTPTRYPKSISRVAENVTIITAEQIQAVNAHTVADVLNTVTGIQVGVSGGPGSPADVSIQGSDARQVLVMIDGVSQNSLSEGKADIGAIPVQNIERIEILKGPASSAWGSSLGGVINIITKSPDDTREAGGTVSASIGNRNTGDYRGEVSGKVGSLGYYLSGGGLISDGLLPHNSIHSGNVYTKLNLETTEKADLTFSFGYNNGSRGFGEYSLFSFDNEFEHIYSTLSLNYILTNELALDLSLQTARRKTRLFYNELSTGVRLDDLTSTAKDTEFGGNAKLSWTQKLHQLLLGVEFDLAELEADSFTSGTQRLNLDKWALFANDTLNIGDFSLIPGLRYDYTSTSGDFWSPSLGATFALGENTILRAYVARGFNIPPLGFTSGESLFFRGNPDLKMETVWSYAAGFETAALRYFWLKTMFFRHDINDVISSGALNGFFTKVNEGKQRRQGVETELRTMPVYNTSIMFGYTYVDATDRVTGEEIPGVPLYTLDAGVQYDDKKSFQGTLKGHYIRWRVNPPNTGRWNAMIWDLNLAKKVLAFDDTTATLFFTAHNIFDGAQYPVDPFRNPRRWFEGGLRFNF